MSASNALPAPHAGETYSAYVERMVAAAARTWHEWRGRWPQYRERETLEREFEMPAGMAQNGSRMPLDGSQPDLWHAMGGGAKCRHYRAIPPSRHRPSIATKGQQL